MTSPIPATPYHNTSAPQGNGNSAIMNLENSPNGDLLASDPSAIPSSVAASCAAAFYGYLSLGNNYVTDPNHHRIFSRIPASGLSNDTSASEETSDGTLSNADSRSDTTDTSFSQEDSLNGVNTADSLRKASPFLVPRLPYYLPMLTTVMPVVGPSLVDPIPISLPRKQEDDLSVQMLHLFEVRFVGMNDYTFADFLSPLMPCFCIEALVLIFASSSIIHNNFIILSPHILNSIVPSSYCGKLRAPSTICHQNRKHPQ